MTEYQKEYIKKQGDVADKEMRDFIKKNNVDSNLKNVVGKKGLNGDEMKRAPRNEDDSEYYQPKKWNKPKVKKEKGEMKEKTRYQKDYEAPDPAKYQKA